MIKMNNEKKWSALMNINEKAQKAFNKCKETNKDSASITLTKDQLLLIAELAGSEATILKRTINEENEIKKALNNVKTTKKVKNTSSIDWNDCISQIFENAKIK